MGKTILRKILLWGYFSKVILFCLPWSNPLCIGLLILCSVPNICIYNILFTTFHYTIIKNINWYGIIQVGDTFWGKRTQVPFALQYLLTWMNVVESSVVSSSRPTSHRVCNKCRHTCDFTIDDKVKNEQLGRWANERIQVEWKPTEQIPTTTMKTKNIQRSFFRGNDCLEIGMNERNFEHTRTFEVFYIYILCIALLLESVEETLSNIITITMGNQNDVFYIADVFWPKCVVNSVNHSIANDNTSNNGDVASTFHGG